MQPSEMGEGQRLAQCGHNKPQTAVAAGFQAPQQVLTGILSEIISSNFAIVFRICSKSGVVSNAAIRIERGAEASTMRPY